MIGLILIGLGIVVLCAAFISVNTNLEGYFFRLVLIALLSLFGGYVIAIIQEDKLAKAKAQECLQSGGEWVRYSESGFTCVGEKK